MIENKKDDKNVRGVEWLGLELISKSHFFHSNKDRSPAVKLGGREDAVTTVLVAIEAGTVQVLDHETAEGLFLLP